MYRAKGRLWPLHAHLLATSLRSLLRHFAFPIDANYTQSSKFAKANLDFHLFVSSHGPWAFGPVVCMKSPSPSSLGAQCLLKQTSAFARCWDFMLSKQMSYQ